MLKAFSIDVYALLDLGATLLFFSPLVAKNFDIFPNTLHGTFIMSTPVGESSRFLQKGCIKIFL